MCQEQELPISVNLDGPAITQAVCQAILDSVIGDEIKKGIEALLGDAWSRTSFVSTAVTDAIKKEIGMVVLNLLREREADLKALVREYLTDTILREITGRLIDSLLPEE